MSKGLEASKEVRLTINILITVLEDIFAADDMPIKETIKNAKHALKQIPEIEKELKALEIIRKHYYGNGVLFGEMTKEELDFIKEVLL